MDEEVKKVIDGMTPGCFILALEVGEKGDLEAISMHKCKENLSIMIGNELLFSLHQRYLSDEQILLAAKEFNIN